MSFRVTSPMISPRQNRLDGILRSYSGAESLQPHVMNRDNTLLSSLEA